MFGNKRGKKGAGQGRGSGGRRGQGQSGGGRGQKQRAGGPTITGDRASSTQGFCVCQQCGYREPHASGVPCMQQQCPQCGAIMGRQ